MMSRETHTRTKYKHAQRERKTGENLVGVWSRNANVGERFERDVNTQHIEMSQFIAMPECWGSLA